MSANVISFAAFPHVVIEAGTVTASTTPEHVGKFMFFVEYHDGDWLVCDYSGSSHADALAYAKGWGVPVFDRSQRPS